MVEDFTCSLVKRLGDHTQKNEISRLKFTRNSLNNYYNEQQRKGQPQ